MIFCSSNIDNCPVPFRENIISNTCNFELLQIDISNTICNNYASFYNYCEYYNKKNLYGDKFLIYNLKDNNNEKNIVILPSNNLLIDKYNTFVEIYYLFTCNDKENIPRLEVNIVSNKLYELNYLIIVNFIIFMILLFIFIKLFLYLKLKC